MDHMSVALMRSCRISLCDATVCIVLEPHNLSPTFPWLTMSEHLTDYYIISILALMFWMLPLYSDGCVLCYYVPPLQLHVFKFYIIILEKKHKRL